jgi:UDP-N-acetyl-D-mannosaminuronate dehydrogenase
MGSVEEFRTIDRTSGFAMWVAVIGLGQIGVNITLCLILAGHEIVGFVSEAHQSSPRTGQHSYLRQNPTGQK